MKISLVAFCLVISTYGVKLALHEDKPVPIPQPQQDYWKYLKSMCPNGSFKPLEGDFCPCSKAQTEAKKSEEEKKKEVDEKKKKDAER